MGTRLTKNVGIRECLHKMALFSSKVKIMFSEISDSFCRCGKVCSDFYHLWRTCEIVKQFWKTIWCEIETIMKIAIPFSARLFSWTGLKTTNCETNGGILLSDSLVAARLILTKKLEKCRNTNNIWWDKKVRYMMLMDKLTSISNFRHGQGKAMKKIKSKWNNFIIYWEKLEPSQNTIQQILQVL